MMRRYLTVRLQTTLVAVLVTGIALLVAYVSVVRSVRDDLTGRIRDEVRMVGARVAKMVEIGAPIKGIAVEARIANGTVPPVVEVHDLDTGEVVVAISPVIAAPEAALPPAPGTFSRMIAVGSSMITHSEDVAFAGRRYRVIAAAPSSVVSRNTATLRRALGMGFPALAFLVGMVTWTLTGRSLRPVERIRAEAESITAATLDRRVPVPPAEDEVAALAVTMNRMLDRLEASARRQREFVSDASHELRSPIASIRTELEVALRASASSPSFSASALSSSSVDWPGVASNALAENERLERLVDDLLTLARLDEGRVPAAEDVDLDDVVREEVARLRDPRIAVSIAPVRVRGNREQLARVVRNLLENAQRYARSSIKVTLSSPDGGGPSITVEDDGPGIPPADRERVFERFTRLDEDRARTHGGVGLGLALVRAIMTAHGGSVSASAGNAGGAHLRVTVPWSVFRTRTR